MIGGTVADYETLVDSEGSAEFDSKMVKDGSALPVATDTMNFAPMVFYSGDDLMLKIQNYVPPMKEELQEQAITVDTWKREMTLPGFFYQYFMSTFMIPAYTCDQLQSSSLTYPGLSPTYSCYCNNGDYHTMPNINIEINGKEFQYDMGPANYMFLPYLNYTVPMSLCILGIEETPDTINNIEYVSLGQR